MRDYDKPPCLILRKNDQSYSAWSESGRLIATCCMFAPLDHAVRMRGYAPVPLNSRIAATIIDKIRGINQINRGLGNEYGI